MNDFNQQLTPPLDPMTGLPMQVPPNMSVAPQPGMMPQQPATLPLKAKPTQQPGFPAPQSSLQALANMNRAAQMPLQDPALVQNFNSAQQNQVQASEQAAAKAAEQQKEYEAAYLDTQAADAAALKVHQDNQRLGNEAYQTFQSELQNSYKAIDDYKINPDRLMSGGNRVIAAVSLALGEVGGALSGRPNGAAQTLRDAIERDIYAQKAELDKIKEKPGRVINAYGIFRQKFGDDNLAELATRDFVAKRMDRVLAKIQATSSNNQTIQNSAALRTQLAQTLLQNDTSIRQATQNAAMQANSTAANVLGARENNILDNKSKGNGTKQLSSEMTQDIAAGETALKLLDDLENSWNSKSNSSWSGLSQYLPHTEAGEFSDDRQRIMSFVGKGIEGGKMTDEDFKRHLSAAPTNLDGSSRARNKIAGLRKAVLVAQVNRIRSARQAGYDTSGIPMSQQVYDYLLEEQKEKQDAAAIQNGGQTTPQGIKVR